MPDQGWTVYTSWRRIGVTVPVETSETHPSWPEARRAARQLACLRGVLLISVQGPGDVVAAEYDRVTNYWRDYPWPFGVCGNDREPDGEVCMAELFWHLGSPQIQCWRCNAWHGALSRPEWHTWQASEWTFLRLRAGLG